MTKRTMGERGKKRGLKEGMKDIIQTTTTLLRCFLRLPLYTTCLTGTNTNYWTYVYRRDLYTDVPPQRKYIDLVL